MKAPKSNALLINVRCPYRAHPVSLPRIRHLARNVLQAVAVRQGELSITFVSNAAIRQLNRRYKKKNRATDVLAFPFTGNNGVCPRGMVAPIGDIIISLDQAALQAEIFGMPYDREVALYVIHGILHLAGYDDMTPGKRRVMEHEQQRMLEAYWKG